MAGRPVNTRMTSTMPVAIWCSSWIVWNRDSFTSTSPTSTSLRIAITRTPSSSHAGSGGRYISPSNSA